MAHSPRRDLPDNLDPLVDTLSNVVGILIVVVALTQLQVGSALDRLIELDAMQSGVESHVAPDLEERVAEASKQLAEAAPRREAIRTRHDGALSDAIAEVERTIADLQSQPAGAEPIEPTEFAALEARVEARSAELGERRQAVEQRTEYEDRLRNVPRELVARLPDPGIVTGEEAWILCRYGRCVLTDRARLIETGSTAIGQALGIDGQLRQIRPDEFESVAHHFRKRDIGVGDLRWRLETEPVPRARLDWRSRDAGIDRTRLASSRALQEWLGRRSPERDFIRFKVWNDSFETYLVARQVIESAGFRAGWDAFAQDQELELPVTFGRPPPREGPVEID